MKLHKINDSSDKYVIKLLEESFSEITDDNIIKNYHPNYASNNANIFCILNNKNGRYKNGCYYVLENNNELVCSAGWNEYELDRTIALILTRAYVAPKYRAKYHMGEYILPDIVESTKEYVHRYITSNSYNSAIYQFFVRASQGKRTAIYNDWPEIYKKFKPAGVKNIYYTDQYVAEYIK
jgi:hypothetical protein